MGHTGATKLNETPVNCNKGDSITHQMEFYIGKKGKRLIFLFWLFYE